VWKPFLDSRLNKLSRQLPEYFPRSLRYHGLSERHAYEAGLISTLTASDKRRVLNAFTPRSRRGKQPRPSSMEFIL
jgi:hypothetical protein